MISLPEILFAGDSLIVAPNSVVLIYCEVNSNESTLTKTWYKDNVQLVHADAPHIVLRNHSIRLALFIDDFQAIDNGVYHCAAQQGNVGATGKHLYITG